MLEQSHQNLTRFLLTEVDLGLTFARAANRHQANKNIERYEINRRNALAALEAIDRFKILRPQHLRREIEPARSKLAAVVFASEAQVTD